MTERERLIKLIKETENNPEKTCPHFNEEDCFKCKYDTKDNMCDMIARKADYLLANGVIAPPCKVGDMVYVIYGGYVAAAIVLAFYIDREGGMLDLLIKTRDETVIGFKTVIDKNNYTFSDVFLTEEEAENALEEHENNDRKDV